MAGIKLIKRMVFLSFFLVMIIGCAQNTKKAPVVEEQAKESADTGILFVDSYPGAAQVYLDGELKGDSPSTIDNVPVGSHNLMIKKEGYMDFEKKVTITVGRKEEIEARLSPLALALAKTSAEEEKPKEDAKIGANVSSSNESSSKLNSINISQSYIMYFDFKNELFTDLATATPDIFSTKYETYIRFTAYSPITMRLLNKPVKDLKKEDCIVVQDTIGDMYSGQSLCVKTAKGLIAVIGGSWTASPQKLEWFILN